MLARDLHGGDPVVLVVEAELSRVALVSSAADYLGRDVEIFDVETNRSREEFVARRHELQGQGFDAVATEETELDDVSGCWAVFDPNCLAILGRLPPQAAEGLETDAFFPEVEFESVVLFRDEGFEL